MTEPVTPAEPPAQTPEEKAAAEAKKKAENRQANVWGAAIVGVLLLCCIGFAIKQTSNSDPEADRSNAAVAQCESAIKDQLKAPSTADFSDERYTDNDPSWLVTGNVDAENSFGAKIRSFFRCELTRDGDSFIVTSSSVT